METVGPALFAKDSEGRLISAIGTLFPRHRLLVTESRMHALQREVFRDWHASRHPESADSNPAGTPDSLEWESGESVDLIFTPDEMVLIRPEFDRLDLAFAADALLQEESGVPEHRIRFLFVNNPKLRQALRERGQLWRMSTQPVERENWGDVIEQSRVAIREGRIYFYNAHSGTRFVTCATFAGLKTLDDAALASQLDEIGRHSLQRNRHRQPEVAFFEADALKFGPPLFCGLDFTTLEPARLRAEHHRLAQLFEEAVAPEIRVDDPRSTAWRERLFAAITREPVEAGGEAPAALGGAEFPLRIRWLPGGRFEDSEFIPSSVPTVGAGGAKDEALRLLQDPLARGFTANFIREFGNLEYLNLGRLELAPRGSPYDRGRRGAYLAELKVRGEKEPRVVFMRVQRWGIRERLEQADETGRPKDFVRAVFETEEYIDYTLDRRLACRQFGMKLPPRMSMRRTVEVYNGSRTEFHGRSFPVIYYERDYLPGIPANMIAERKLADVHYAVALAGLLGRAAAPNLVVGRALNPVKDGEPGQVLFDNGDEIIIEGSDGLPLDLIVTDHGGAFADWKLSSLLPFAPAYAEPVNRRAAKLPHGEQFAAAYLDSFQDEMNRILTDYRRHRKAFDGLFRHLPYDEQGSFACRWACVLKRLDATDIPSLTQAIEAHIHTAAVRNED